MYNGYIVLFCFLGLPILLSLYGYDTQFYASSREFVYSFMPLSPPVYYE